MSGKRVTPQEIVSMKHAFFQGNTLLQVAKDFKRTLPTVRKLALRGSWETEREAFIKAYEVKAETRLLDIMVKDIGDLEEMQGAVMKEFREEMKGKNGSSRVLPAERIDKILKIIQVKATILGIGRKAGSLSGVGQGGNVSSSRTVILQGLPPGQLESMRRKLLEDLGIPPAKVDKPPPEGGGESSQDSV